jgi:hypothetical protein
MQPHDAIFFVIALIGMMMGIIVTRGNKIAILIGMASVTFWAIIWNWLF